MSSYLLVLLLTTFNINKITVDPRAKARKGNLLLVLANTNSKLPFLALALGSTVILLILNVVKGRTSN